MNVSAENALVHAIDTLVIVGTGGHARKLYNYAAILGLQVEAFVDDNPDAIAPNPKIPCRTFSEIIRSATTQHFIVAIGNAAIRKRLFEQFQAVGWIPITLIHPSAYVAMDAHIGAGTVICAHAVVETGVSIGTGTIIDIGMIVDHDCVIGDYCHLKAKDTLPPRTEISGI